MFWGIRTLDSIRKQSCTFVNIKTNKLKYMNIDICFSPVLFPFYKVKADSIVVVVDVFRASTTICAAFKAGANSVISVASLKEAEAMKSEGFLVGAERNTDKCDFADFGNSPFDYTPDKVRNQDIAFTTTNGTQALEAALGVSDLIIGTFSNISKVVSFCCSNSKDVLILCAGWNNRFNIEDSLFGGALADRLLQSEKFTATSDSVIVALSMWKEARADLRAYLSKSEHIQRMLVRNLQADIDFCLKSDTTDMLPVYDKASKRLVISR